MLHQIYQRLQRPPWEVLGVEWTREAMVAWEQASMRIVLEHEQSEQERVQAQARQSRSAPARRR